MAALHDITYLKAIHHRSGGFSESGLSSFIGSELHTKPISRFLYVTRVLALLAVRSDLAVQPRATVLYLAISIYVFGLLLAKYCSDRE